ncbi:hypothetical protein SEUCBS140593_008043 [Sporothrix eucalyptigena]|uniref:Protamine P1 n=1 Tax=Sporothrix eucalyptigena TaxID=1812306 RepID=A0ABP0CI69_9PEZI
MPNLPVFGDELLCGEPTHDLNDILLSGSDDEYYDSPGARSRRLEDQARLFLEGHRPLLLSASLRGPFGREAGWENPWRGRVSKVSKKGTTHSSKAERAPMATASDSGITGRKRAAAPVRLSLDPEPSGLSGIDLGATLDITYTDKEPEVKKRAAGADWLRRRNLKRMRPTDNELTASPTPSRSSRPGAITVTSDPKTPTLARSVSVPVEDALPADNGAKQQLPQLSKPAESEQPVTSDIDTATPIQDVTTTAFGDNAKLLSAVDSNSEVRVETLPHAGILLNDSGPDVGVESRDDYFQQDAEPADCNMPDEHATSYSSNASATSITPDTEVDMEADVAEPITDSKMESGRLATQDQSPWAKPPTGAILDHLSIDDDADLPRADGHREDANSASLDTAQSPWAKETQTLLPAVEAPPEPESSVVEGPYLSLSQNPWADTDTAATSFSSSLSNLPTSPCSPGQEATSLLPTVKSTHSQDHEPFLASLPTPIPVPNSSGTAPSTPETKQSSLPTPDMTVSIKSFRRFRSPTPTPPPRRQRTKSGGPRSILSQPHRRPGAVTSASRSGSRVRFALPQDGETSHENENDEVEVAEQQLQRAASPPPQDKLSMESLPTEVDRFRSHFATIAERTEGEQSSMAVTSRSSTARSTESSIPSIKPIALFKRQNTAPELNIYSGPSVDAMASRFLEADADMFKLQQISDGQSQQSPAVPRLRQNGSDTSNNPLSARDEDDKENTTRGRKDEQREIADGCDDAISAAADDVQDVMDNLDDFLGLWDMDAELAQARSGRI